MIKYNLNTTIDTSGLYRSWIKDLERYGENSSVYENQTMIDLLMQDRSILSSRASELPKFAAIIGDLQSIQITTPPNKTVYHIEDKLDLTGMVVTATFTNITNQIVGYDVDLRGEHLDIVHDKFIVSFTYNGVTKTAECPITVETYMNNLKITTPPNKVNYSSGELLNLTGMVVTAYFDNGTHKTVTGYDVKDINKTLKITTTEIVVTYTAGNITMSDSYPIFVVTTLDHIEITTPPTKVKYNVGDNIDLTNMVVTAYYTDGDHYEITDYTIDMTRPVELEDTEFIVSYTYNGITKTTFQSIVTNRVLLSITITKNPNIMDYGDGDTIDLTGMVVTATFEDGDSIILGYTLSNTLADMNNPDVIISYTYDTITKTATLPLTVGIARRYVSVGLLSGDAYTGIPAAQYSTDGIDWTSTTLPGDGAYYDVAYGNGTFIAVGVTGNIARSTDGINWENLKDTAGLNPLYDYNTIIFASGIFICANDNGIIYKSSDYGDTWTSYVNRSVFLEGFKGTLSYIRGKLYFEGYSEGTSVLNGNLMAWSTDLGVTWNIDETTLCGIRGVINNSPIYIANHDNNIFYSENGIDWTNTESLCTYNGYLAFGNGTFISLYKNPTNDSGKVFVSRDGQNWLSASVDVNYITGVVYAGGKFITTGYNNHQYYSEDGVNWETANTICNGEYYNIATSFSDDITYTDLPLGFPDVLLTNLSITNMPTKLEYVSGDMFDDEGLELTATFTTNSRVITEYRIDNAYVTDSHSTVILSYTYDNITRSVDISMTMVDADKRFMVLGNSELSYSTELLNWTDTTKPNTTDTILSVYCNNGVFVITGTSGASFYSSNGVRWYRMNGLDTDYAYGLITYADDRFVTVSNYGGLAYYTLDNKNWVSCSSGLPTSINFKGIAYGDGGVIIVGTNGTSYYTDDFTSWTRVTGLSVVLIPIDVVYGDNKFVCITSEGRLYKSDGTSWEFMLDINNQLTSITYGDGKFVIVGANKIYTVTGNSLTNTATLPSSIELNDVVYAHGKFVAVGKSGVMYKSYDAISWIAVSGLDTSKDYTKITSSFFDSDTLALDSIYIDTNPTKMEYYDDEELDLSGITLMAKYIDTSDNSEYTEEVFDYESDTKYVDFDNATVKLSFQHKGVIKTCDLMLTINIRKRYVTVGVKGKSYYSLDNLTWTPMNGLDDSVTYRRVAYGNGRFITVGPSGLSYYSLDGKEWYPMTGLDIVYNLLGVAFGSNTFVCVGYDGKSYYSTDGQSWNPMGLGLYVAEGYADVVYGNGRFITVGYEGASCYSTDGRTWNNMTGLDNEYDYIGLTYGNNRFITVGNNGKSYYSIDGETWVEMSGLDVDEHFWGVSYANGQYVCVGTNGKSYYSVNGIKWKPMTGLDDTKNYWSVTYGNGKFVCVGFKGSSYYSEDGRTWTKFEGLDTNTNFLGITDNYTDGDDIVLQSISIVTPPNKTDYVDGEEINLDGIEVIGHFLDKDREVGYIIEDTHADVNNPTITVSYTYNGVTCTDTLDLNVVISDMYMVVGQNGESCISKNGFTWVKNTSLNTIYTIMGVAFGQEMYVAILSGVAYYSIDGRTWKSGTGLSEYSTYRSIVYGDDKFVLVGQKGLSYYSTDGKEWIHMSGLNTNLTYYCVAYGNGTYVCGGDTGNIYYSHNGQSWSKVNVAGISSSVGQINSITYGSGRFIAVAGGGKTFTSTDGITWAQLSGIPEEINVLAVVYGNNKFVCTCSSGASYVLHSDLMDWEAITGLPNTVSPRSITYSDNKFVCVYNTQSYYTIDCNTWLTMSTLPIQAYAIANNF